MRAYLDALEANRPKRGRKRTPESIAKRIATIDAQYETAGSLTALQLLQERKNLEAELAAMGSDSGPDLQKLQHAFVKHARAYSQAKGIEPRPGARSACRPTCCARPVSAERARPRVSRAPFRRSVPRV